MGKTNMTRPRLVYDDDCGFCTWSVEFVACHGEFTLIGFSELSPDQRGRLPANYEECAHLITDDRVYSCGEAMEEAFARTDLTSAQIVPLIRQLPGHSQARAGIYQWIADNRDLFGTVISSEPPARQSR
jgi:predicted DCC family thiol-disulfide oxidoreductase YuxK